MHFVNHTTVLPVEMAMEMLQTDYTFFSVLFSVIPFMFVSARFTPSTDITSNATEYHIQTKE